MVSIKDVAKKANVSISAVSKTLNGYTDISKETKKRIYEVIEELNYIPNVAAQKLSSIHNKTIGLILGGLETSEGIDGILYQVMRGVYMKANECGYEVISIQREMQNQARSYEQICHAYQLAGIIIQGLEQAEKEDMLAEEIKTPTVFVNDKVDNKRVASVISDNVAIGYSATNYLIELGHKNIMFINGKKNTLVAEERYRGFQQALAENKLNDQYVYYADFQESIAYEVVKKALAEHPAVSAIFCASDLMAIGALNAAKSLGYEVPSELSIIGVDGIILTDYTTPTITTIKQDFFKMGQQAFLTIKNMIETGHDASDCTIEFELLIKNSTYKAK